MNEEQIRQYLKANLRIYVDINDNYSGGSMISAEAKEAMYDKPACVGRNDTLLDLLNKMPSCITVDGIDYHFVLKKAVFYRAYYEGEGEEGSGKVIFGVTAYSPIDLLTEMLEELKEEGLLE